MLFYTNLGASSAHPDVGASCAHSDVGASSARPKLTGDDTGQSTVEAAFLIPIVFLLLLILAQPTILLYNRIVMENAAAESCRLVATMAEQGAYSADKYAAYIKRRLASIPPLDIFHLHSSEHDRSGNLASTWQIELQGDEQSDEVSVRIVNKLKPLPIVGLGMGFLGQVDAEGNLTQSVEYTTRGNPIWL